MAERRVLVAELSHRAWRSLNARCPRMNVARCPQRSRRLPTSNDTPVVNEDHHNGALSNSLPNVNYLTALQNLKRGSRLRPGTCRTSAWAAGKPDCHDTKRMALQAQTSGFVRCSPNETTDVVRARVGQ